MFIKVAHPVLRISTICALLFVFIVTFLSYQAKDASIPPGTQGQFIITRTTVTQDDAIKLLGTWAKDLHINIYKRGYNPDDASAPPWYFAFIGNQDAHNNNMGKFGYPAFDPGLAPTVLLGGDLEAQGVIGTYSTTATSEQTRALLHSLLQAGIQSELITESELQIFLRGVLSTSSAPILIALALAVTLSIFYTATYNLKANAIKHLHGHSRIRTAASEVLQFVRFYVLSAMIFVSVSASLLVFYNGLNQIVPFMQWLLTAAAGLLGFMLLVCVIALAVLPNPDAVQLLKGKKPLLPLTLAAGSAQVIGLMLIFTVVTMSWTANLALRADEQSFDKWAPEAHSVTLQINLRTLDDRDPKNITPEVRQIFRDFLPTYETLNARGKAVLSIHPRQNPSQTAARGLSEYNPDSGNSLIVNNQFLQRNPILAEDGGRILDLPSRANHIDLLIPESARTETSRIVDEYKSLNWRLWELGTSAPQPKPLDISVRYTQTDQEVFNYGDSSEMKEWTQKDPVIAVVNRASDVFSGWYLLTVAANSGHITFTDAKSIADLAADSGLDKHLVSLSSSSVKALEQLEKRRAESAMHMTNMVISSLILALSVMIMAAIYIDRNKLAVFIKHVHGWSLLRTHSYYFIISTMVGAIAILLVTNLISDTMRIEKSTALCIGALVLLIASGGILAAVYFDEKRTRGDFVKRS